MQKHQGIFKVVFAIWLCKITVVNLHQEIQYFKQINILQVANLLKQFRLNCMIKESITI